jgi:hypothetical protein
MAVELKHVANPVLYGAPPSARPRSVVAPTELPLCADDLPIAAAQTAQQRRIAKKLPAVAYQSVSLAKPAPDGPHPEPRRNRLSRFAGRILRRPPGRTP